MGDETSYRLSTSMNEGIVEIAITGEVTNSNIDRLHTEVIAIVNGKNAKAVLCDVTALKGHHDAFSAAYFRARSIPPDIRKLPAAIIEPSVDVAYKSFYETTAANVGQSMRWFADIEAARAWLKSRF